MHGVNGLYLVLYSVKNISFEKADTGRAPRMKMMKIQILAVLFLTAFVRGSDVRNVVEVKTPTGWVHGYEERVDDKQVFRFIQIPYAQPPVGELRFQKPRPIEKWENVQGISDEQSTGCSQWYYPIPGTAEMKLDEDCLFLNIYVPGGISTDRNLSVMVWIHGGGFVNGAGTQYNPVKLASKGDVIVITINYRLGLLGFFTMNDPLAPGNYGLWDMIEALRWIQNNIAAFGGNPNSVTIFGQSAGAAAVSLLPLIPSNKGLFQRAISQSGMVFNQAFSTRETEKKTVDLLLERTDCKGREDIARTLKCLREVPVENITNAITFMDMLIPLNLSIEAGGFLPSIDGELFKDNLGYPKSFDDELYELFRSIDFMSGTADGEGNVLFMSLTPEIQELYNFNVTEKIPARVLCEMNAPVYVDTAVGNVPELSQEICDFYSTTEGTDAQSNKVCEFYGDYFFIVPSNTLLSIHAKDNMKTNSFQYLLTRKSPVLFFGDPPSWFKGAFHGDELPLLFDTSRIIPISEETFQNLEKENELSETVIRYWTNFAKFGNPNGEKVPEWPSYDVSSKKYVIIDKPIKTGENLKAEATELLSRIIEKGRQRRYHDEL